MAATVLADAGFIVALLRRRDTHHAWAAAVALEHPPPWTTCEAVLAETFFLVEGAETALSALLQRGMLVSSFSFSAEADPVLDLMKRYAQVPMSFADACLVRMSELASVPLLLTTDSDFQIYRRLGRRVIPTRSPN